MIHTKNRVILKMKTFSFWVASVSAYVNRAVIYRYSSLHSGDISPDDSFDLNPLTERFTIASFLHRQVLSKKIGLT
ncbi:DUF6445 family protein [Paraglaciecola sp.]|uniref:DUF6445 family protein n=1 Tax=Paraglaciecola sp. TaxID=1920173 RepID=UPI003556CAEB